MQSFDPKGWSLTDIGRSTFSAKGRSTRCHRRQICRHRLQICRHACFETHRWVALDRAAHAILLGVRFSPAASSPPGATSSPSSARWATHLLREPSAPTPTCGRPPMTRRALPHRGWQRPSLLSRRPESVSIQTVTPRVQSMLEVTLGCIDNPGWRGRVEYA